MKNLIYKLKVIRGDKVNTITSELTLRKEGMGAMLWLINRKASWMLSGNQIDITSISTTSTYNETMTCHAISSNTEGTDGIETTGIIHFSKAPNTNKSHIDFSVQNDACEYTTVLDMQSTYIDIKGLPIKDIKNHAHSALSGTKKLIEIMIGDTPYYAEVYPTKA